MILRLILFLILNFGALGISGFFTGEGVPSDWYVSLDKAPWTPPGWMFGAAWTTIMVCFSFYMAFLWPKIKNKNTLLGLYVSQWILNVSWSPVFFFYHEVSLGLVVIASLTILTGFMFFYSWPKISVKSLFILPYTLWLIIATSLNGYILLNN